jgi:hypothetical protein
MNARVCARFVVIALTSSHLASAQQPSAETSADSESQASVALAEAYQLGKKGDAEGACVLFEKSARLSPSADALLNAGICREFRADLVGALTAFERALDAAAGQPKRLAAIQPRIDAIRPRIPTVSVVAPTRPDVIVELDGKPIREFGVPLRLNPGEHQFSASSPNTRPHTETFFLMPAQVLAMRVPELEPEAPPAPTPVVSQTRDTARPKGSLETKRPSDDAELASGYRTPLVVGGIALFALGGAFSVWQFSEMSEARSRKHDLSDEYGCNIDGSEAPSAGCDAGVRARIDAIYQDDEEPARKRAWLGVAASGAGAATALVSYFALPAGRGNSARSIRPSLELGPGVCAARLSASW